MGSDSPPEDPINPPKVAMEPPAIILEQAEAAAAANAETESEFPAVPPDSTASTNGEGSGHHDSHRASNANIVEKTRSRDAHDTPIETVPTPAYSETLGVVDFNQDGFGTRANIGDDGRVNIKINQRTRKLSNLLAPALRTQLDLHKEEAAAPHPPPYIPPSLAGAPGEAPPPPLNVVIHVVGSRGDVQPFVSLGQVLKKTYGHRVRLATHPTFKNFVEENGLEFFSIGGDPAELMAFMVKNPGLMPGIDSLKNGDVGKRRKGMYELITGCWRSCIEAGDGTGMEASDDNLDQRSSFDSGISVGGNPALRPFVADAIIANPPSFAHVHCAEKLGIPLHMMFTMPWSPTQSFPHPLANITSSNADQSMTNFVSYALVEMMTWQGLGDIINRFREKSLGLEPVSIMWAPGMVTRLRIPYTYCWSPALIPKPKDWGQHIDITGFFFLSLASNYTPPEDLAAFLAAGPPPVYIGFGSIVVDDPNAMTKLIFDAVKKTGQRALVSKGWGGIGAHEIGIPEGVFMLGNCPHDWLFKLVSCVVHHGGAGTTAAGIATGRPTVVVPFFGDQPFWGAMVARAGAGPTPVPYKNLTADKLAASIMEALKPQALERAEQLGAKISKEHGADVGAESFHHQLRVDSLRCTLAPSRTAVWRVKRTDIRLSAFAATVLGNEGLLDFSDLKLYRPREYDTEDGPWDPITGGASALIGTIGSLTMGIADFPIEVLKSLRTVAGDMSSSGDSSSKHNNKTPVSSPPASAATSTLDLSKKSTHESTSSLPQALSPIDNSENPLAESNFDKQSTERAPPAHHNSAGSTASLTSRGSNSMASALNEHLNRRRSSRQGSRQSSRSGSPAPGHHRSGSNGMTIEGVVGAGRGVSRIVGAGLKSPMDFTMSLARGFHNAPKLYGDESVRESEKITGVQSGLKAAGKEFGYGFYDGITGLITQPLAGAQKEGGVGLLKGIGKGFGGLILKPGAAIWGLPGYTSKGIYKELQKHFGSSVQNYIIAARTAQGYEDWKQSTEEERQDVVNRWSSTQLELQKKNKKFGKDRPEPHPHGLDSFKQTRKLPWDERKKIAEQKKKEKEEKKDRKDKESGGRIKSRCKYCPFHHEEGFHHDKQLHHAMTFPENRPSTAPGQPDFEEAITRSVTATSRGNPEEDRLIERALRASVAELQMAQGEGGQDHEAYDRAVQASVNEANRARAEAGTGDTKIAGGNDGETDHDRELSEALRQSLHHYHLSSAQQPHDHQHHHQDNENELYSSDSGLGTEDDEDYKSVLEESKRMSHTPSRVGPNTNTNGDAAVDEEEFKKALEESEKAHSVHQENLSRQLTEEEIVLEYVKKQSLKEAELKGKMSMGKEEESDEDLKRAMEESLKIGGEGKGKVGEASG